MKWVIDSSAINYVATESRDYSATFASLTQLVSAAELTFCDEVVVELERTAPDAALLWAQTVKEQRAHSTAPYATQRWVLYNVDGVVDPDDRYDAAAQVIAQARALMNGGEEELAVVTEDTVDKPTRRAISSICQELDIPWTTVPDMMGEADITWP